MEVDLRRLHLVVKEQPPVVGSEFLGDVPPGAALKACYDPQIARVQRTNHG